jgi:hypothetical protein
LFGTRCEQTTTPALTCLVGTYRWVFTNFIRTHPATPAPEVTVMGCCACLLKRLCTMVWSRFLDVSCTPFHPSLLSGLSNQLASNSHPFQVLRLLATACRRSAMQIDTRSRAQAHTTWHTMCKARAVLRYNSRIWVAYPYTSTPGVLEIFLNRIHSETASNARP